jgi:predicted TIM-barrel fold metal-dependent hydrolase
MFCTFYPSNASVYPKTDPLFIFSELLSQHPKAKIIFMHGGGVEILKYAEFARYNKNILLDLSYTVSRYKGSSIDNDLIYVLNNIDQNLCFGTDAPYVQPREAIYDLSELIKKTKFCDSWKSHKIWFDNLNNFLGL